MFSFEDPHSVVKEELIITITILVFIKAGYRIEIIYKCLSYP